MNIDKELEKERFREEMRVTAAVDEGISDLAFDHYPFRMYDFKQEDPELTGRADEEFPEGVILVRDDGARFFVEWQVLVNRLPVLEEDQDYIDTQLKREQAEHEEAERVDPNQMSLMSQEDYL